MEKQENFPIQQDITRRKKKVDMKSGLVVRVGHDIIKSIGPPPGPILLLNIGFRYNNSFGGLASIIHRTWTVPCEWRQKGAAKINRFPPLSFYLYTR